MSRDLNTSKKLYIIGTGGFAREVLCLLHDVYPNKDFTNWVHFAVPKTEKHNYELMGIKVVSESDIIPSESQVIVGVGDPTLRKKIVGTLSDEISFPTVIHPKATVSKWVKFSEGCLVTSGCVLTCNIKVGAHAHFNLNSTVGHDCSIGDFITVAPGTNISGECTFGDCVNLGTNSAVRQGVKVTSNVVVGMGGTVVKDIVEPGVYVGVPVKRIK